MRLALGDSAVTGIVEQPLTGLGSLIPSATPGALAEIDWLSPHYLDRDGTMLGVIQTFVVEHAGVTVVVDTCVGDGKDIPIDEHWAQATTGFLDRFCDAGFDPMDVDFVLCTHLHVDHVGWNTTFDGSNWVPTFPNARYLFDRTEYEHWRDEGRRFVDTDVGAQDPGALWLRTQARVQEQSVQPILDAGLADLVDAPHEIVAGLRLIPTVGHTPGHVSVEIFSEGTRALITGDSFHHPCQIAHPEWSTVVDFDTQQGGDTRQAILDDLVGDGALLLGSHFAPPGYGQIVRGRHGDRLEHR